MNRLIRALCFTMAALCLAGGHAFTQDPEKAPKKNLTVTPKESESNAETSEKKTKGDSEKAGGKGKTVSEIIITATKTGINKKETGASLSVITEEEIKQKGKMNIAELLKEQPGIFLTQNGPLGGIGDLYIRGTNPNHVVVLVDGVRLNDPASVGHGFDFGHLTTDNIERIEIIRGSQSTLYGSDAIGGVVNIITKKGSGNPQLELKAEGGTFKTFKESVGVSGGNDWSYYSFNVSRTDSKGFSRTSTYKGLRKSLLANRDDGYENTSFSTRVGVKTLREGWLSLSFRYTDADMKIADAPYQEARNHTFKNNNLSLNLMYTLPVFEWWESTLLFSYMNQFQQDKAMPDQYTFNFVNNPSIYYMNQTFNGKTIEGEFKNKFKIMDVDEILCGVTYTREQASTNPYWYYLSSFGSMSMDPLSTIDNKTDTWAVYAQNHLKLMKRIFIIAGARFTQPDNFHYNFDYSLSGSFIIPVSETRLKANVGTGYKTHSLYELYYNNAQYNSMIAQSFISNEQFLTLRLIPMRPERSLSYDAGVEQPLFDKKLTLELNWYSIQYKPMIWYNPAIGMNGYYTNISALTQGIECIATAKPIKDLSITAYYTLNLSYNRSWQYARGELLRRPKHQAGITVNYAFLNKGNVNAIFIYVGSRRDYWLYPYTSYINSYCKLDLAVSWWIVEQLQAFVRVENVLNQKYEETRGYKSAPCSVYGGLKVVL